MVHGKLEFLMPASEALVFDAFHYHQWRARWDSLVSNTRVSGGAPCPSVGAVTDNAAGGLLRGLSMRTKFVTYDRPHLAAAFMLGSSFPFTRWAASMRHSPARHANAGQSLLIYTYTFEVGPAPLRWAMRPVVKAIFHARTRRRFERLQDFLKDHAHEIEQWQRAGSKPASAEQTENS